MLLECRGCTGFSLNIVFFPKNVVIFLNSASSAVALVFYLPVCRGKTVKGKSPEYFRIFEKNTIFIEHPVHALNLSSFNPFLVEFAIIVPYVSIQVRQKARPKIY